MSFKALRWLKKYQNIFFSIYKPISLKKIIIWSKWTHVKAFVFGQFPPPPNVINCCVRALCLLVAFSVLLLWLWLRLIVAAAVANRGKRAKGGLNYPLSVPTRHTQKYLRNLQNGMKPKRKQLAKKSVH